jgi:hypothetical protein
MTLSIWIMYESVQMITISMSETRSKLFMIQAATDHHVDHWKSMSCHDSVPEVGGDKFVLLV